MMQQSEKRAQILEAAIRRFAHFGVQKTTLTEIADDLGITKQAIAHYFPGKQSLSLAVEAQIIEAYFNTVEAHFAAAANTGQALMELLEVKKSFFEKYALLITTAGPEIFQNNERLAQSRHLLRSRMVQLIAAQLQQGVNRGELKPLNTAEVAGLLFDTMSAFEHCAISRQVVPGPETFAALCTRQQAVIQLIVAGLKSEQWKS